MQAFKQLPPVAGGDIGAGGGSVGGCVGGFRLAGDGDSEGG